MYVVDERFWGMIIRNEEFVDRMFFNSQTFLALSQILDRTPTEEELEKFRKEVMEEAERRNADAAVRTDRQAAG